MQALGLVGVHTGIATLYIFVSNPSNIDISIDGFTLGTLKCILNSSVEIPAGAQGVMITITLPVSNGYFSAFGVSVNGTSAVCSGQQVAQVGAQYSGYITTVSGQTYPFTVTASS